MVLADTVRENSLEEVAQLDLQVCFAGDARALEDDRERVAHRPDLAHLVRRWGGLWIRS